MALGQSIEGKYNYKEMVVAVAQHIAFRNQRMAIL
jgi:hypothetical protein